jgi:hypothetical protein
MDKLIYAYTRSQVVEDGIQNVSPRKPPDNCHRLRQHLLDLAGSRTFPRIAGRD